MPTFRHKAGDIGRRVIKLTASLVFYSASWLWRQLHRLAGKVSRGTCVVLYYHAVPFEQRARFARQMDVLVSCAKPVKAENTAPLEDGVHHAAVVFHDAFVSVCDNALPELARRGIPSTLFVPSGYLGRRQGWITDKTHSDYMEVVVDAVRLKALDSELVSVGSHTVSHSDLSALRPDQASEELDRSRTELETILGREVGLFAFPYGRFNQELTKLSKRAGYQRVFTIRPEMAFSTEGEYVTGSCAVSPIDWDLEFKLKLLGAYQWLLWIYRIRSKAGIMFVGRNSRPQQHQTSADAAPLVDAESSSDQTVGGSSEQQARSRPVSSESQE
jgi:peptidoglycan/xylan/chitin deacetylase (PgdA/CDA1 family)